MEFVSSKTASWASEPTVGHREKGSELEQAPDEHAGTEQTKLDDSAEVGKGSATCSVADETKLAEVGTDGTTCGQTTRVLEN